MLKRQRLLTFLLMTLWLCSADASRGQMPRGAFLVKPAHSVAQLAEQVRGSKVVASRYKKHFGITAEQFAQYVQSQLGLRRLSRTGSYRVYFIKPDGSIGWRVRRLRQGTPVFLHLRSGKPILLGECGNPMHVALPGLASPPVATLPPRATPPPPPHTPQAPLPELPVQTPVLEVLTEQPALPLEPVALTTWQADPVFSSLQPAPPLEQKSRRIPLLPLVFLALTGAFHEGSRPSPSVPIPEPHSVLVVGTGLALLAGLRARRKRY